MKGNDDTGFVEVGLPLTYTAPKNLPKTYEPAPMRNGKVPEKPTWWYNGIVDRRVWDVSFPQMRKGDLVEVHGRANAPSFSSGMATGISVRITDMIRIMKHETLTLKRTRSSEDLLALMDEEHAAKRARTDEADSA